MTKNLKSRNELKNKPIVKPSITPPLPPKKRIKQIEVIVKTGHVLCPCCGYNLNEGR